MALRLTLGLAMILLWFGRAPAAVAQRKPLEDGTNEFGFWTAGAPTSHRFLGHARDHKLYTAAFRYGRTFVSRRFFALTYTCDVIPVAVFTQPGHRDPVYAGGAHLGGLRVNLRRRRRVQPFFGSAGGFLAAAERVPFNHPAATKVNFSFEFAGGVQVFNASATRALTFGYKLQHVSNAMRTKFNPGGDYSTVFFGLSFFRQR